MQLKLYRTVLSEVACCYCKTTSYVISTIRRNKLISKVKKDKNTPNSSLTKKDNVDAKLARLKNASFTCKQPATLVHRPCGLLKNLPFSCRRLFVTLGKYARLHARTKPVATVDQRGLLTEDIARSSVNSRLRLAFQKRPPGQERVGVRFQSSRSVPPLQEKRGSSMC